MNAILAPEDQLKEMRAEMTETMKINFYHAHLREEAAKLSDEYSR